MHPLSEKHKYLKYGALDQGLSQLIGERMDDSERLEWKGHYYSIKQV